MCGHTPVGEFHLTFRPQAVSEARAFVRQQVCGTHGSPRLEDALLVVSELTTNGIRHGAPPVVLTVECQGDDGLRVTVTDGAPTPPHLLRTDRYSESGRGLLLVDWVSRAWGVEIRPDGKATWVLI